jgi:hypothetical protein
LAAAIRVMPGAWYQRQLDAMRRHVLAKGKNGWRSDWQAYWISWLTRALDIAGRADALQPAPCTAGELLSGALPGDLYEFRQALIQIIGASQYGAWFKDCDMRSTPDGVTITARSAFAVSYLRDNFSRAARTAAKQCGLDDVSFALAVGSGPAGGGEGVGRVIEKGAIQ